jgi:hypothetical protein
VSLAGGLKISAAKLSNLTLTAKRRFNFWRSADLASTKSCCPIDSGRLDR